MVMTLAEKLKLRWADCQLPHGPMPTALSRSDMDAILTALQLAERKEAVEVDGLVGNTGASADADRAFVPSASSPSVSPVPASIPSAWFAWPVLSTWEEVEVELLQREGVVFRTNAAEFEYWLREPGSDGCDDIMAFRIVGLMQVSEDDAHHLAGDWQRRHNAIDEAATYGEIELLAQGIEACRAETGTGSVHESPVAAGDAPEPHSEPSPIVEGTGQERVEADKLITELEVMAAEIDSGWAADMQQGASFPMPRNVPLEAARFIGRITALQTPHPVSSEIEKLIAGAADTLARLDAELEGGRSAVEALETQVRNLAADLAEARALLSTHAGPEQ